MVPARLILLASQDRERFQLLNAFDMPRLTFEPARKLFSVEDMKPGLSLHAGSEAKIAMLRER